MLARIARRDPKERLDWSVSKYFARPKLLSHRATELPWQIEGKKAGVRQAVVRISSEQLLRTRVIGSGGGEKLGEEMVKRVVENVVVQRRLVSGKEDDWVIIGFAEETGLEDIKAWRRGEMNNVPKKGNVPKKAKRGLGAAAAAAVV